MSLINDNIKELLALWAEAHEDKNCFPDIADGQTSYYKNYTDRNPEEIYLMEYSLQTMEDVKNFLKTYSGLELESELLKRLTVAICQNRPMSDQESAKTIAASDGENSLPEYVYVF
ncbi:hypothetical protein IMSAGC012_01645 [Lachnospiraceae bacterium]|nr:hypothetical protein IMSAGC012_01645 [Lachnospiraceae bacterium]